MIRKEVRGILDNYLELNNLRKTPERYAILDAVYGIHGHFSLNELGDILEKENFRVSRATLYNTMKLLIGLRLVIRHRFIGQTKYEACYNNRSHTHQVCTICGNVTEINSAEISRAIDSTKLKRFRKDGYTLYIYGVCSMCQARITRKMNNLKQQKQDKQ